MALQIVFLLGFLSFGLGLLILARKYRKPVEKYLNLRFQRNYFMAPVAFFDKGKSKKGRNDSMLVVSALVLIVLGISTMLRVNAVYNAESELRNREPKAGHPVDSRERPAVRPESQFE